MGNGRRITIGLAILGAVPLLYVLSFGPACWITAQVDVGGWNGAVPPRAMIVYWPLGAIASDSDSLWGRSLRWWMTLGVKQGYSASVPMSSKGNAIILKSNEMNSRPSTAAPVLTYIWIWERCPTRFC